jgi:Domain of unknown function (DUF5073)
MSGFDPERASRAIGAALAGPGGVGLVVKVFCGLPGVLLTPPRRGLFRSQPERIQIGEWRYEVTSDGRLSASHLVNGIVIAEEVLPAGAVGPHVARSLGQVVNNFGPATVTGIDAAVELLETSGPGF